MPSKAARKPSIVYPAATSRIERASAELTGPPETRKPEEVSPNILKMIQSAIEQYGVRPLLKALETYKDELMVRLVRLVKIEGAEDEKGKLRYETDLHKFQVIAGRNVYIGETELRKAMTAAAITPKVQAKILNNPKVMKVTEYEYVGVYKKDPAADENTAFTERKRR